MRKSFGSQAQLCHVWAQQSQESGYSNNMLFNRTTDIYSYGTHYLAAKIHTHGSKRFALVRSDSYGPATTGHLCEIRNALFGLMPFFLVTDVVNPRAACHELDALAESSIATALKRVKVASKEAIKYELERIKDTYAEANKLRSILGLATRFPKKPQLDAVELHLKARLKRYGELNTPEMKEKRVIERAKREARAEALAAAKQADDIARFKAGENVSLYGLAHEYLRVKGDEVCSSRGACVPLREALALYRAIRAGRDVNGLKVGSFTVIGVTARDTDSIVQIGCHKILLSEAASVLEPLTLKAVQS